MNNGARQWGAGGKKQVKQLKKKKKAIFTKVKKESSEIRTMQKIRTADVTESKVLSLMRSPE